MSTDESANHSTNDSTVYPAQWLTNFRTDYKCAYISALSRSSSDAKLQTYIYFGYILRFLYCITTGDVVIHPVMGRVCIHGMMPCMLVFIPVMGRLHPSDRRVRLLQRRCAAHAAHDIS